jgi:hypothetical protein
MHNLWRSHDSRVSITDSREVSSSLPNVGYVLYLVMKILQFVLKLLGG